MVVFITIFELEAYTMQVLCLGIPTERQEQIGQVCSQANLSVMFVQLGQVKAEMIRETDLALIHYTPDWRQTVWLFEGTMAVTVLLAESPDTNKAREAYGEGSDIMDYRSLTVRCLNYILLRPGR